jgi:hypothetical protein
MTMSHFIIQPHGDINRSFIILGISISRMIRPKRIFERRPVRLAHTISRDMFTMIRGLYITGPADEQLLMCRCERANARYHGSMSISRRESPGALAPSLMDDGLGWLWLSRTEKNVGRLGGWRCRWSCGWTEYAAAIGECGIDGKLVANMDDTTGERDSVCSVLFLEGLDLGGHVSEGDVASETRRRLCETVHGEYWGKENGCSWLSDNQMRKIG